MAISGNYIEFRGLVAAHLAESGAPSSPSEFSEKLDAFFHSDLPLPLGSYDVRREAINAVGAVAQYYREPHAPKKADADSTLAHLRRLLESAEYLCSSSMFHSLLSQKLVGLLLSPVSADIDEIGLALKNADPRARQTKRLNQRARAALYCYEIFERLIASAVKRTNEDYVCHDPYRNIVSRNSAQDEGSEYYKLTAARATAGFLSATGPIVTEEAVKSLIREQRLRRAKVRKPVDRKPSNASPQSEPKELPPLAIEDEVSRERATSANLGKDLPR